MKVVIEKNPEKRLSPIQRKQRIGKGFVYHQSSQPFYKVKILMKNLEKEPELYVNKIEKKIYQVHRIIQLLKILEEIKQGMIRVHGGAIALKEDNGILVGACQDVGKTTFVLLLSQQGYYILGDDQVKVAKDGFIFRVQEKAGVFPHPKNLKYLNLSFGQRIAGWFKYHFIRIPFLYKFVYPNLWVSYEKIGRVLDKADLQRIYILEKGKRAIYPISPEEGVKKILASSLEIFLPQGFPKRFFYLYCFANDFSPTFLEDKYKEILREAFENKDFLVLQGEPPFDFYNLFLEHEKK